MYPGSQDDNFLPFTCPMDHVLSPHDWKHVAFRDAAFLTSERLPPATRKRGIVDIDLVGRGAFDALSPERRARAVLLLLLTARCSLVARLLLASQVTLPRRQTTSARCCRCAATLKRTMRPAAFSRRSKSGWPTRPTPQASTTPLGATDPL